MASEEYLPRKRESLRKCSTGNKVLPVFDTSGVVLQCHSAYNRIVRKRMISHERLRFRKQDP